MQVDEVGCSDCDEYVQIEYVLLDANASTFDSNPDVMANLPHCEDVYNEDVRCSEVNWYVLLDVNWTNAANWLCVGRGCSDSTFGSGPAPGPAISHQFELLPVDVANRSEIVSEYPSLDDVFPPQQDLDSAEIGGFAKSYLDIRQVGPLQHTCPGMCVQMVCVCLTFSVCKRVDSSVHSSVGFADRRADS